MGKIIKTGLDFLLATDYSKNMKPKKRKTSSPIEIIKRKVSGIVFSDQIKPQKSKLTMKEFNKIAEEVKQTFKNDYFARPQFSF